MQLNQGTIIQSRSRQMSLKGRGAFGTAWLARCVIVLMTIGLILPSCQWLPEVAEVELSLYAVDVQVGTTTTINANVLPKAADYERIIWESSDPTVVGVTNGRLSGLKIGTAKVTASAEGVTSTPCVVTVKPINVTGVKLDKSSVEITEGETFSLSATISPANATDQSVKWGTGAAGVATVSDDGLVTAVAPGKTAITVTTNDGGKTASCQVTVKAKVIPVTGVWIDQSTLSLTEGESGQLKATVSPSNATNKDVTWTSSNTSITTVSSNGTVTAKKAGTATITVKTADQGKTATCEVTVKAKTYPVTGVSLSQSSLALTVGATSQLTATVSPSNATNKEVSWSSSKTSVATVSSDGTVTAKSVGSATITVTTADGSKKATCVVTVQSISVTGVSLNPATMSLVVGSTGTLTATVSPSNATNKAVTYSSSNPAVAKASSDGVVTALAAGSTTITVKTADGGKTATCIVTVKKATVAVTGVTVTRSSMTLGVGESYKLGYSIKPSNATDQSVTWFSRYAPVAKVASDGTVTGISPGTAEIVVLTNDGNYTASCMITVKAVSVAVTGVSLDKSSMSLVAGSTGTLKATIAPSTATNKGVTWSSSNTAVATVSTSGVVTAKAAGSATITCTTSDGGKTASCMVTVTTASVAVTGVSVTPTSLSLTAGETYRLGATISPSNATNPNVSWSSSNTSVATVASDGTVTAKAAGSATITCTTQDGSKKATSTVTVKNAVEFTIYYYHDYDGYGYSYREAPSSITYQLGDHSGDVMIFSLYDKVSGERLKAIAGLGMSNTNTSVADTGFSESEGYYVYRVIPKKVGDTIIHFRYNDQTVKTVSINVTEATVSVTGVSLDKTSLSIEEGKTASLTATVSPSNATNKAVTWSSSNTSVATVSSSGVVTAKAAGSATITCTTKDGSKKATCAVTVQTATNIAVDLGMVVDGKKILWASYNLGATKEYEYGDYYAWGETETKSVYSWSTYKWCNGSYFSLTKYNKTGSLGTLDYKTVLEIKDDAAHVEIGGNWRMPTIEEWTWLKNNCNWEWTADYNGSGVAGMIVTATNSNSIFLPASGFRQSSYFLESGSKGIYWSSSLGGESSGNALTIGFSSEFLNESISGRDQGNSIRPVLEY